MSEQMFEDVVGAAARDARVKVTLVEKRMQGRDHPVLSACQRRTTSNASCCADSSKDRGLIRRFTMMRMMTWKRGVAIGPVLVLGLAAALYVGRQPVLETVGRQLMREDRLEHADAIAVLAGRFPEREIEAVDLFRQGHADRLILTREREFTGLAELRRRGVDLESGIDMRVRVLVELGVPTSAIVVLEETVLSTMDEADGLTTWAVEHDARTIIVLSSRFHTRRVSLAFNRASEGRQIRWIVRAAEQDAFHPETWWTDRVQLLTGIVELQKLVFYWLRY